jgi:N-acyl-L-homoserine lactone synthetase
MTSSAEANPAAFARSADPLKDIEYRLAQTPAEKEEIYNLRYRAYLREGAVKESAEQRVTDQYDDAPNAWTIGVFRHGELLSSFRISVLTPEWRMSCSMEAFGEILEPRLDRGETIIDPSRFVADPDKAVRLPELPYVTIRLGYLACEHFNADTGLAIVRAEHQNFYRRVFLHQTIAEPRFFPGLLKPVGLMAVDFPASREKVFKRYPMMRSTASERRRLFERSGERRISPGATPFERASIAPHA